MYNDRSPQDSNGTGSMLLMFCAGALAGAAVALVIAPSSGREVRETLGRRGRELADDVLETGKRVWSEQSDRVVSAVRQGYEQAASEMGKRGGAAGDSGTL